MMLNNLTFEDENFSFKETEKTVKELEPHVIGGSGHRGW